MDESGPMKKDTSFRRFGADLDARIAELSPSKRALLLKRLSRGDNDTGNAPVLRAKPGDGRLELSAANAAIASAPRTGDRPLSFAQQRLWFLDRLLPNTAAYNIPTAWRLQGPLEVGALASSLEAVVARHETLRTRVALRDGEPVQVIDPPQPMPLSLTDLSALPPAARETRARQLADTEARQPFALEAGPLLRAQLLRLAADEHLLLLTVHHIVSDGWSVGVFNRELAAAYAAFVQGREPAWPALPIQYADYAVWQREWLQGEALEEQLGYWKRQLAGMRPLEVPTDRPRPAVASHQGAHLAVDLPPPLTDALKALGRREGTTLFMTLLAAFQVLLARYSGHEDIAVGTPIAGRRHHEVEGLIGFFVNTLVLRTDLSGNPRFRELLGRVREIALGAYTHQDLPFEKLVHELAPARDLSRHPLFQAMFVLQNTPGAPLALEGVAVSRLPLEKHSAKFDLSVSVRESADGLHARWEYAIDLFDTPTMVRLAGHFQVLLEAIVADPEQRIGQLPLLTAAERHQLLVEWNDTAVDYPRDRFVHQLFEEQAARTPEAVAVACEDRHLTYAELNARANQLAHHLRSLGVGPEVLVGLCLDRSLELVVGLLGILKAGGAYVPLDPSYPSARLAFMLKDSAAPVVLAQRAQRDLLSTTPSEVRLLCLDTDWPAIAECPDTDLEGSGSPENIAYVIYTSGSTGQPKGVLIPHGGLCNHVHWMNEVFRTTPRDRVLQHTSISFDASVWEFVVPLSAGATLVLAHPGGHQDMSYLARTLRDREITIFGASPSTLRALLEEPSLRECRAVRYVISGGEALDCGLARRFQSVVPAATLGNFYGTTEASDDTTYLEIGSTSLASSTVPIGRPIANAQCYVLDSNLEPVPVGVMGELYIGGAGLARGYLNRPTLTAERFIPHPFRVGDRLYRTYDSARYLPDGNLDLLGRLDDQVKIRGFRIELGEIQSVLAEHPAVRQALVLAREDTPGDTRLVAYVVPADTSGADLDPLRAFLRERLPDYMRPAAYVWLEHLPLTPNGKIDRQALPAPGVAASSCAYEAPIGDIEATLAQIWAEVLSLDRIGRHDNFFDLGGHSLLAAKFVSLLRDRADVDLPISMLFESQTPATLAERLSIEPQSPSSGESGSSGAPRFSIQPPAKAVADSGQSPLVEILGKQLEWVRRWKGTRSTPESFIVTLNESGTRQGLFWCLQAYRELTQLARHLGPDQPVHGMRSGHLLMKYTDESVGALASHYAAEMIALQPDGAFLLGGNCQGTRIAHAIALRLRELGRTVSLLILMERSTFPPYDGPVALIFGRDSRVNPYKPDADPDAVFRRAYPAGFTVDIIDGTHGRFFQSPNVETLALALKRRLSGSSELGSGRSSLTLDRAMV